MHASFPRRRSTSPGPLDALPAPGGDVEVSMVSQGPGGSALNTAWHLAAQGTQCTLHAALGDDRMGQMLRTALETESKAGPSQVSLVTS